MFTKQAEMDGFTVGFMEELAKIAADTHRTYPFDDVLAHPERYEELLKEAGLLDTLKRYGTNIKGMATSARDTLTGGNYAKQMRELGSANPMSTSSTAGKVVGNQQGPMRDLVARRAQDQVSKDMLDPAYFGLPSQAVPQHPSAASWGVNIQRQRRPLPNQPAPSFTPAQMNFGNREMSYGPQAVHPMAPGGATPLFGAPR